MAASSPKSKPSPTQSSGSENGTEQHKSSQAVGVSSASSGNLPNSNSGRGSPSSRMRIIPELFQDYNEIGYRQSLSELDAAFDDAVPIIVIEPYRLGDETSRWIAVGNFLHKSTVITGVAASVSIGVWPRAFHLWLPLAFATIGTCALYTVSWAPDPASQYQILSDSEDLAGLRLNNLNTQSVVVLTKRDSTRRKILHSTVTSLVCLLLGYKLFQRLQ